VFAAVALVLAAACVLLFLPVSLRLAVGWEEGATPPWKLSVRLWRIELLPAPRPRRAPASDGSDAGPEPRRKSMPPWMRRLLRWAWKKFRTPRRPGSAARKRRGGNALVRVVLRFLKAAFVLPTRRIQIDLGGIDPATLATLWGLFLAIDPLLPRPGTFRFRPDWECFRPKGRLSWHLRASLAGFLFGLLRSRRGGTSPLLPSGG